MYIEIFEMERMQSTWENVVKYNLSESGVHPMTVKELLEGDEDKLALLAEKALSYSQSNGTKELRALIARFYPGATTDNVEVTCGGSEANFICTLSMVEREDEVVFVMPNYMQVWGLLHALGARIVPVWLREEARWQPDPDEIERAITGKTKLVVVCNPNNPTGALLSREAMEAILKAAAGSGAWILADEIYQGTELNGQTTPSFWGRYERVIVTNGLSKAYGLPGLRIGWVVAPQELIARFWSYHDYITISPASLSDMLARIALEPERRARILERTRAYLHGNLPVLKRWIDSHNGLFEFVEPKAGAIAFIKYHFKINSTELANRLREEKSVLIVPGDHFKIDGYIRIGYGPETPYLRAGLSLIDELLTKLVGRQAGRR